MWMRDLDSLNLPLPEGLTSQDLEQMVRELTGVVAGGAGGDVGSSVTGTDGDDVLDSDDNYD